jgi:hypothetical protein
VLEHVLTARNERSGSEPERLVVALLAGQLDVYLSASIDTYEPDIAVGQELLGTFT